jgi:putative FmdB family regulatory protein
MPNYGYICQNCNHEFDRFCSIDDREKPLSEACEKCTEHKIVRNYTGFVQGVASDINMTPNKKTGGQWNQLMNRMKKGMPKRFHKNLDIASNRSGKKWN